MVENVTPVLVLLKEKLAESPAKHTQSPVVRFWAMATTTDSHNGGTDLRVAPQLPPK